MPPACFLNANTFQLDRKGKAFPGCKPCSAARVGLRTFLLRHGRRSLFPRPSRWPKVRRRGAGMLPFSFPQGSRDSRPFRGRRISSSGAEKGSPDRLPRVVAEGAVPPLCVRKPKESCPYPPEWKGSSDRAPVRGQFRSMIHRGGGLTAERSRTSDGHWNCWDRDRWLGEIPRPPCPNPTSR